MRLAEITEELCRGVGRGETQCHQNAGEWEEALEEWWVTLLHIIPENCPERMMGQSNLHLCMSFLKITLLSLGGD